jgi:hypothetical protein
VGGSDRFTVFPVRGTALTIQHFNNLSDVINLSQFSTPEHNIYNISDLKMYRGSTIIHLPRNQSIVLKNVFPEGVREENFLFGPKRFFIEAKDSENEYSRGVIIGLSVGLGSVVFVIFYVINEHYQSWRRELKYALLRDKQSRVDSFRTRITFDMVFDSDGNLVSEPSDSSISVDTVSSVSLMSFHSLSSASNKSWVVVEEKQSDNGDIERHTINNPSHSQPDSVRTVSQRSYGSFDSMYERQLSSVSTESLSVELHREESSVSAIATDIGGESSGVIEVVVIRNDTMNDETEHKTNFNPLKSSPHSLHSSVSSSHSQSDEEEDSSATSSYSTATGSGLSRGRLLPRGALSRVRIDSFYSISSEDSASNKEKV